MNETELAIYDYIRINFEIDDDPDFTPDVNLFDYGFVDSLGATEILMFVEQNWNIAITQADLTLYPMNSVREIAGVVSKKLRG
ncbi:MAG TPA: phosphopantetheine attachment protein [Clostridiales bacterium]|nr:phosphopantetheine attachment protein [Clostridiales bacterium]HBR08727.1 phosphopantetheine attachment protein [Clostridiales bacterium]